MTNRIALILALVILGAIVWDVLANGAQTSVFLARKIADLVEWLAFWR